MVSAVLLLVFAPGLRRFIAARVPAGSLLPDVAAGGLMLVSVAQLMGSALTTEFVFGLADPDRSCPRPGSSSATGSAPCRGSGSAQASPHWRWAVRAGSSASYRRWLAWTSLVLGAVTTLLGISPLQYLAGMFGPLWLTLAALGLLPPDARPRVMTATRDAVEVTAGPAEDTAVTRLSARFGLAFAAGQLSVMIAMAVFVLPNVGSPGDPALERGHAILDAETAYRLSNYAFMVSGTLLLGFLGAVHVRLRRVDASGVLSTVAVAAGTMLALVWPLAGVLHDVALDAAAGGTDVRLLAGWDSIAPYSLAFSVLPRVFFIGALVLGLRMAGRRRGCSGSASCCCRSACSAARPWSPTRSSRSSR